MVQLLLTIFLHVEIDIDIGLLENKLNQSALFVNEILM